MRLSIRFSLRFSLRLTLRLSTRGVRDELVRCCCKLCSNNLSSEFKSSVLTFLFEGISVARFSRTGLAVTVSIGACSVSKPVSEALFLALGLRPRFPFVRSAASSVFVSTGAFSLLVWDSVLTSDEASVADLGLRPRLGFSS